MKQLYVFKLWQERNIVEFSIVSSWLRFYEAFSSTKRRQLVSFCLKRFLYSSKPKKRKAYSADLLFLVSRSSHLVLTLINEDNNQTNLLNQDHSQLYSDVIVSP